MTATDHRTAPTDNSRRPLTVGYLAWFCLPLALTFLMMSGAAPVVSTGISRMHGADGERLHLAAFLTTFACCLTLYSPMFAARNVAIRTITDRRSLFRYASFFIPAAIVAGLLILAVSRLDVLADFLLGRLLGIDTESRQLIRGGMLAFTGVPFLIALRGIGQGCHISNGQSHYVGIGTGLRLATMILFVFGYAIHHDLSGPVLGGLTFLLGIGAETAYVLVMMRSRPQWRDRGSGPVLSFGQFARYAAPLMAGAVCIQVTTPILITLIHQGRNPAENDATFNLVRDTGWILFSMLMTMQPAVVTYASSKRNFRLLVQFAIGLLIIVTALTLTVALTPLRETIFLNWLEVDNEIIRDLTFTALLWLIPIPCINLAALFTHALHTRSGRTAWIFAGNLIGLAVLLTFGQLADLSNVNGVFVAVIGGAVFNGIAAVVQIIGLACNGGLAAAIAPTSLAEQMVEPHRPTPELMPDSEPSAE